ncbi:MAG: DNA topoisomerase VI subunit B [Candidatus Latescibacteria bacterium]|nr:DNA topoisomerase VI subunit B [Candidatus Latescibacterota bacterium]NIM22257.1 DNA topoisomerase VI subunit B [Candidatus Latescibacterota bacterium]NIM65736.1 DNA topoisomerase VI subunit B [Candidatus Latescibacterota bacterium]NIO02121.1 DNA topoisomerase VI subunit B [Candidatus Latescibacterota bacterium]NIO28953.1 DNA topoisomerase VI subunit B [Candidatus Latescibacterota bacterium]
MATSKRILEAETSKPVSESGSFEDLPLFDADSKKAGIIEAASKKKPSTVKKNQPSARKKRARRKSTIDRKKSTVASEASAAASEKEARGKPVRRQPAYQTAQTLALRQREISVSEFFAKNRHLLGFDSLTKALLTAIKEAVDNSLDACEEAGLLPDLLVEILELSENRYKIVVEDSGPGIVKSQVPKIFGKLLYGSKFHTLKQARGQQGIGISAAGMYAQLTTGKPVRVITRTGPRQQAHVYELQIDTKKNMPVIISEGASEWSNDHGTRIEMEIMATYKKGQRSVDTYMHQVAMANPHAHIVYRPPKDAEVIYPRVTESLPPEPLAIKPHPHGVELGVLLDMLKTTKSRNIRGFLTTEFTRMSSRLAGDVLEAAGLPSSMSPKRVTREGAESIINAFGRAKIMKPPTNCLSVIGGELLERSVAREIEADYYTAVTRPPAVYRGNPFQVEIAFAYGGTLPDDEIVKLYRYANRAPLIYQQAGCAMTHAVNATAWRNYGLQQARGALPSGPLAIVIHIASVWVPFTSESKESIAHYPEIIKEIKLALQECGRGLSRFIRRGVRERDEAKKRSYIERYIPHIGIALREILSMSEKEETRVVDKLKTTLERSRKL